ncbi:MAG: type I methionyl aminopeptidase [Clostridia bacterium]|nr:type I methionyl aminopeptidase [Clostridia bacterium]MBR0326396.1 type I methionyl aminopeptidase [Clostridia bacterium]
MVRLKNAAQIAIMKEAGRITGEAILTAAEHIREGVSTKFLDTKIREYIEKCGAKPSFLGYGGFPASACISINDEVIHGIPSDKRILTEGDIVKIDVGAFYKGFHGDCARTFAVGTVTPEAQKLIDVTTECFFKAVAEIKPGARVGDIGHAVQSYAEANGYGVVREYVGHGIGSELHESPEVPNFGREGRGIRLFPGMALAIEPMINVGTWEVKRLGDGWTVKTKDGSLSAHYENTVIYTDDEVILTTVVS